MNALVLTLLVAAGAVLLFAAVFAAVWKSIHVIANAEIRRKARAAR